jgi:hypothetical protein
MDFRTKFHTNKRFVWVSTEFVVEYFAGGDGDCFENVPGHVQDDKVANSNMDSGMECGMGDGQWLG